MWQIDKKVDDYGGHPSGKCYIFLNADKPMSPYHISYPVTWSGQVGGYDAKIIQLTDSARRIEDFNFEVFPEKYSYLKTDIINWIDEYLHKMLD